MGKQTMIDSTQGAHQRKNKAQWTAIRPRKEKCCQPKRLIETGLLFTFFNAFFFPRTTFIDFTAARPTPAFSFFLFFFFFFFLEDWCLSSNIDKTKIMIFNNAGRFNACKKKKKKKKKRKKQAKPWSILIILSQSNKHLAFESILADCQYGFLSQGSCETLLVQLVHPGWNYKFWTQTDRFFVIIMDCESLWKTYK